MDRPTSECTIPTSRQNLIQIQYLNPSRLYPVARAMYACAHAHLVVESPKVNMDGVVELLSVPCCEIESLMVPTPPC